MRIRTIIILLKIVVCKVENYISLTPIVAIKKSRFHLSQSEHHTKV